MAARVQHQPESGRVELLLEWPAMPYDGYPSLIADDMFKLTVDKMFPPPEGYHDVTKDPSPYPLLNYPNDQNVWDKVRQY